MDFDAVVEVVGSDGMLLSDKVWDLFSRGIPCSWCDRALGLPDGMSRRIVVGKWLRDKLAREQAL